MKSVIIFLLIIIFCCLFINKETFKNNSVKFSVPELTDDDTAELIGGLQEIGSQACENAKYDNKKTNKNRPKC